MDKINYVILTLTMATGITAVTFRPEHSEIYVVSCPSTSFDVLGVQHFAYGPTAAYTWENDAEKHVQGQRGCSYTHVLLEPAGGL